MGIRALRLADYKILKTLGCPCYPLLPKEERNQLMPKSRECVFLGYATQEKSYRCLDFDTRENKYVEMWCLMRNHSHFLTIHQEI